MYCWSTPSLDSDYDNAELMRVSVWKLMRRYNDVLATLAVPALAGLSLTAEDIAEVIEELDAVAYDLEVEQLGLRTTADGRVPELEHYESLLSDFIDFCLSQVDTVREAFTCLSGNHRSRYAKFCRGIRTALGHSPVLKQLDSQLDDLLSVMTEDKPQHVLDGMGRDDSHTLGAPVTTLAWKPLPGLPVEVAVGCEWEINPISHDSPQDEPASWDEWFGTRALVLWECGISVVTPTPVAPPMPPGFRLDRWRLGNPPLEYGTSQDSRPVLRLGTDRDTKMNVYSRPHWGAVAPTPPDARTGLEWEPFVGAPVELLRGYLWEICALDDLDHDAWNAGNLALYELIKQGDLFAFKDDDDRLVAATLTPVAPEVPAGFVVRAITGLWASVFPTTAPDEWMEQSQVLEDFDQGTVIHFAPVHPYDHHVLVKLPAFA